MSCLCGSQKRSTAPPTINPVNIGNLCFLFGVEGALCQFLDLIPETIKAVLDANKKPDDVDDIFAKWARKFAKTAYNIVIDEATGDIDLTSFCSNPPPPLPEDINFSDIFIFMAEVVKILDIFFKTNDILLGDDTRLIDKVLGYWLFKQWYENCECKKCEEPPLEEPPPNNDRPPYNPPPPCTYNPDCSPNANQQSRCKNLRIRACIGCTQILSSCHGFWTYTLYTNSFYTENSQSSYKQQISISKFYVPLEYDQNQFLENQNNGILYSQEVTRYLKDNLDSFIPSENIIDNFNARSITRSTERTYYDAVFFKPQISQNGGAWRAFDGNSDGYLYPPCPPCPPPPPPPEFCDLYPDHPDCLEPDNQEDCQTELVLVAEFTECATLRKPKRLGLITNGDLYDVAVTERSSCESIRSLKTVQYLECAALPPPDPCEGVDCSQDAANIYDDLTAIAVEGDRPFNIDEALTALMVRGYIANVDCCETIYRQAIQFWLDNYSDPEEA